ncbi:MAG: response regulator [Eisenbergiella massiliensis]
MSAYDWESVKEEALEAGINGFLTKPIFRTELLEQMKYYIWDKNKETEKQETEKAVTAKLQPEEAENLQGIRILTAEDNELNREIIVELLENSGAVVDSAQNGKEALDYYLNSSPGYYHLILMDVNMPVMDGLEAVRAIRDSGREDAAMIPVIAMTADVFKEDINKCREAGMNAHIGKPVELDKLYSTLRRFLNTGKSGEM